MGGVGGEGAAPPAERTVHACFGFLVLQCKTLVLLLLLLLLSCSCSCSSSLSSCLVLSCSCCLLLLMLLVLVLFLFLFSLLSCKPAGGRRGGLMSQLRASPATRPQCVPSFQINSWIAMLFHVGGFLLLVACCERAAVKRAGRVRPPPQRVPSSIYPG